MLGGFFRIYTLLYILRAGVLTPLLTPDAAREGINGNFEHGICWMMILCSLTLRINSCLPFSMYLCISLCFSTPYIRNVLEEAVSANCEITPKHDNAANLSVRGHVVSREICMR